MLVPMIAIRSVYCNEIDVNTKDKIVLQVIYACLLVISKCILIMYMK